MITGHRRDNNYNDGDGNGDNDDNNDGDDDGNGVAMSVTYPQLGNRTSIRKHFPRNYISELYIKQLTSK